jgi:hypothetical protein
LLLPRRSWVRPGDGWAVANRPDGAGERREMTMATMDFWYERAIREITDLNEEATELRREAAEALEMSTAEHPDDQDE